MVTPATGPALRPLDPLPAVADAPPAGSRTADETARRLVAAATEVFAEKGYDRAGVAEIARRAGLTTGAIYSRYPGKAALLAAALQDSVPEQFERLFAQSVQAGRAPDLLRAVGRDLVTRGPDEAANALLLEAVVAARRDPEVAAVLRAALAARKARWARLIEASKARGVITEDVDTDALVHFTHAVGLGFLFYDAMEIEHPDAAPWERLIAKLVASLTPTAPAADILPDESQQVTGAPNGQ